MTRSCNAQAFAEEQTAEAALLKAASQKPEMEYLQRADIPTWFKTEKQAKEFMKDMERSTGIRHVLYYGNYYDKGDEEIGGCTVIPFLAMDKDGIEVAENDILYNQKGEQIQVVNFERKDLESYEVLCATQNTEAVNFSAEALAKYWRHSPWTDAEQEQAKREQAIHAKERQAYKRAEKARSKANKFCDWCEHQVDLIVFLIAGMFMLIPIALPVGMGIRAAKQAKEEKATAAPIEIPCTVTDLTFSQRTGNDISGDYTYTYYYVSLKDENGSQLRFRCPVELYNALQEGDNVTVIKQEKTASALEIFLYDGVYKGETDYTINGYEISDAVVVK